jgi:imidazolonepropionase-like amidohydrolase
VLGQEDFTGQLAPGFTADVVAWKVGGVVSETSEPLLKMSGEEVLALLVHRGGAAAKVEKLWVAGQEAGLPEEGNSKS